MQKHKLVLYKAIYGDDVQVPMYEFGEGDPILYIQGGVHGGEVTYFVLHKLAQYLSEVEPQLKGIVTIVPICNPVAWNQRIYYYTAGKFDLYKGKDWNRSYPGGDTSLSARMSKKLFDTASKYPIVIDLHTARKSKPYGIYTNKRSEAIVRTLGLKYNYFIDPSTENNRQFLGTLNHAVSNKGILETTIECGSHDSYEESSIEEVFESLQRLIVSHVLQKEVKTKRKKNLYVFDTIQTLYSPIPCFARYDLSAQTRCRKGDKIATLYPADALQREEVILAPYEGVIFELPKTNILWEGDELIKIVPKECIMPLV